MGGCASSGLSTFYLDNDGDGFGSQASSEFCAGFQPMEWVNNNDDLDDSVFCESNNFDTCWVCDGNDIDIETTPIEANLKWAISKKRIDDEYPGSEIIKKQILSGVKKLRVGIKPETKVIARANTKIFNEENKEIGKVTSGTFGPSVDHPISMGYVDNRYSSIDTKIFLEIRGKKVSANICKLPFYEKNYVKEI